MRVFLIACFLCLASVALGRCQEPSSRRETGDLKFHFSFANDKQRGFNHDFLLPVPDLLHIRGDIFPDDKNRGAPEQETLRRLDREGRPSSISVRSTKKKSLIPNTISSEKELLSMLFHLALDAKEEHPDRLRGVLEQIRGDLGITLDYIFTDIEIGNLTFDPKFRFGSLDFNFANPNSGVKTFKAVCEPMQNVLVKGEFSGTKIYLNNTMEAVIDGSDVNAHANLLIVELADRVFGEGVVKVGAYGQYPGDRDISIQNRNCYDRSRISKIYDTQGVTVAMPVLYPYSFYKFHTEKSHFGVNCSPNERCALFWAPIHRLTVARDSLPPGHQLIPYLAGFMTHPDSGSGNYIAAPPTKSDILAHVQHFRMRGADGYYVFRAIGTAYGETWFHQDDADGRFNGSWIKDYNNDGRGKGKDGTKLNTDDERAYNEDVEAQWSALDSMFGDQPTTHLISRAREGDEFSEKRSGILFSGLRYRNLIRILVSNLGNENQSIEYPDLYGLPKSSPEIPAAGANDQYDSEIARRDSSPQHKTFFYRIVNLLKNGDFNEGSEQWDLRNGTQHIATGGVENSGALKLDVGMSCELSPSARLVDTEPNADMIMTIRAKGKNANLGAVFRYRDKNGEFGTIPVSWKDGPQQPVSSSLQTYTARFTTADSVDGKIWPVLYNLRQDNGYNVNELVVDDIVVKFAD